MCGLPPEKKFMITVNLLDKLQLQKVSKIKIVCMRKSLRSKSKRFSFEECIFNL